MEPRERPANERAAKLGRGPWGVWSLVAPTGGIRSTASIDLGRQLVRRWGLAAATRAWPKRLWPRGCDGPIALSLPEANGSGFVFPAIGIRSPLVRRRTASVDVGRQVVEGRFVPRHLALSCLLGGGGGGGEFISCAILQSLLCRNRAATKSTPNSIVCRDDLSRVACVLANSVSAGDRATVPCTAQPRNPRRDMARHGEKGTHSQSAA